MGDGIKSYGSKSSREQFKTLAVKIEKAIRSPREERDKDVVPHTASRVKRVEELPTSAPTRGHKGSPGTSGRHPELSAPTLLSTNKQRAAVPGLLPFPSKEKHPQNSRNLVSSARPVASITIPNGNEESIIPDGSSQSVGLEESAGSILSPSKEPFDGPCNLATLLVHIGIDDATLKELQKRWGDLDVTAGNFHVQQVTVKGEPVTVNGQHVREKGRIIRNEEPVTENGKPVLKLVAVDKTALGAVVRFLIKNFQISAACQLLDMCPQVLRRHELLGELVGWVNAMEGGGQIEVMEDKRPLLKLLTRTAVELISKDHRNHSKHFIELMNACSRDQRETVLASLMLEPKLPRSKVADCIKVLKAQKHHKTTREGVYKKAVGAVLKSDAPMKGLIMLAQVSAELRGWYSEAGRVVWDAFDALEVTNDTQANRNYIENILGHVDGFTEHKDSYLGDLVHGKVDPRTFLDDPVDGSAQMEGVESQAEREPLDSVRFIADLNSLSRRELEAVLLDGLGPDGAVEVLCKALDANEGVRADEVIRRSLMITVGNPFIENGALKDGIVDAVSAAVKRREIGQL